VKAHPDGYVSQYLHHELSPRTLVHLSQADGDFVLPARVPEDLLLLSGGSGITPVMSMLRTLRDTGHRGRVTFLHYARSREDEMFSDELDELAATLDFARVVRVYTREPAEGAEQRLQVARSVGAETTHVRMSMFGNSARRGAVAVMRVEWLAR
jgi:ferredoxin-NADP reductase